MALPETMRVTPFPLSLQRVTRCDPIVPTPQERMAMFLAARQVTFANTVFAGASRATKTLLARGPGIYSQMPQTAAGDSK